MDHDRVHGQAVAALRCLRKRCEYDTSEYIS